MRPEISIIIPVFNNLDGLKKSIQSIEIQTFRDFEVWIIDGGSSDATSSYLKHLKAPFYFISEKDNGIYDAMNKGITQAQGQWLLFLGSGDVISTPEVFQQVEKELSTNTPLVFGNVQYFQKSAPSVFRNTKERLFESEFTSTLWIKNTLHHQSVFYHHSLFEINSYNIDYHVLADYDLNLRLWKSKVKSKKIDLIIANCDPEGVSKRYMWSQYSEEIKMKFQNSTALYYPLFFLLALFKYLLKINLSDN